MWHNALEGSLSLRVDPPVRCFEMSFNVMPLFRNGVLYSASVKDYNCRPAIRTVNVVDYAKTMLVYKFVRA